MFCRKCGSPNDDKATQCIQCGEAMQPLVPEEIPNYLAPAILVTVFCCVPFGIPAIIFAAQVSGKIQAGDIAGARDSSQKAKLWAWIAFVCGLVFSGLYFIMVAISIATGHK
jgi:interferon-induced transmembrane protein/zinc ribbon protein